ncbi:MAG: cytochrome d ubiquinol oxidase subunit II, partial [Bacteroidales bacterium]
SYEFRSRKGNLLGTRTYDVFLYTNGIVGVVLLGIAVATMFTGADFSVSRDNILNRSMPVISTWGNPFHGLESLVSPMNLAFGFAIFFLSRVQAALYFMNNIDYAEIFSRAKRQVFINAIPFLILFITFMIALFLKDGYAITEPTGAIMIVPNKYFINMIEMPLNLLLFLVGVVLVLFAILRAVFSKHYTSGIWFCGIGTVFVALSLLFLAGYNNTPYYPSVSDIQSSLTIYNSSSSLFTLKVMSIVSLIIPIVVAYIYYTWRSMDKNPITSKEMESGEAKY